MKIGKKFHRLKFCWLYNAKPFLNTWYGLSSRGGWWPKKVTSVKFLAKVSGRHGVETDFNHKLTKDPFHYDHHVDVITSMIYLVVSAQQGEFNHCLS